MGSPGLEEDSLLRKLRNNRRRFQRRMQQLIEKYNHPFEDDPVVQMSTLTYQTPQGYCGRVTAENHGDPAESTPFPRERDPLCPCPADLATAPRNDSLSVLGTSSSSSVSSQTFEAYDICDVTISDLYAGMLHSMSRLLSTKPSSIISTKTFIVQSWSSRRRHAHRSRARVSKVHSEGDRRSWRERPTPCSEPQQETGPLRDCKNLVHVTRHKPDLKLDKAFLAGNKTQILKLDSGWKELQMAPCRHSSLTSLDLNRVHHPDQENRLRMLNGLISPVKVVSRPRMLPIQAQNRYREIEAKFNKLHQECCTSPRKRSCLDGLLGSWAVDVYRGGSGSPGSSGSLRSSDTHRRCLPFSKAKVKRLSEAFENLGQRCVDIGRGPPESQPSPSPLKDSPLQSRDHSWQTSKLFQGHNFGTFRKSLSPSQISVPRIEPLGCGRNRYKEIKEKFDQLHQQYCQASPQQAKSPAHLGMPPDEASAEVQLQTQELFRTSKHDSPFQKWSPSLQWHMRSPQGSPAAEAYPSAHSTQAAGRDPQFPAKRHRLCGHQAAFQDPSEVEEVDPRPGEQGSPVQAGW
ncbi:Holliday junction recognition protein [Sciurus carolinensis]|uniref:Holliday junction recognition protein n=1 Tax=Sciurus carolinensis TaxID=30640 RepID=A0AA41MLA8_SCICA|nr:Holliday junction recognition protein [Sciurus carolinensis]